MSTFEVRAAGATDLGHDFVASVDGDCMFCGQSAAMHGLAEDLTPRERLAVGAGDSDSDSEDDGGKEEFVSHVPFDGVRTWGRPDLARLGDTVEKEYREGGSRPVELDREKHSSAHTVPLGLRGLPNKAVKQVACGERLTLVLLQSGQVWMFGNRQSAPVHVEEFKHKVLQVACGQNHMVAITDERKRNLYTWGLNDKGQLGMGDSKDRDVPTKVSTLVDRIAHISCGSRFTFAVSENGKVYSWGEGSAGQLGLGRMEVTDKVTRWFTNRRNHDLPQRVDFLSSHIDPALRDTYSRVLIGAGAEHATAWMAEEEAGVGSARAARELKLAKETIEELRTELLISQNRVARLEKQVRLVAASSASEDFGRRLDEDSVLIELERQLEELRVHKLSSQREMSSLEEEAESVEEEIRLLKEELETTDKNTSILWEQIEGLSFAIEKAQKEFFAAKKRDDKEAKNKLVQDLASKRSEKIEIAKANEEFRERQVKTRYAREIYLADLQSRLASSRHLQQQRDVQDGLLNQLYADRKEKLRNEFMKVGHEEVEGLLTNMYRMWRQLTRTHIKSLAADELLMSDMSISLGRRPGLKDLLDVSDRKVAEVLMHAEEKLGRGIDDTDVTKELALRLLAVLKDNGELRRDQNLFVRGIMKQTEARLDRFTAAWADGRSWEDNGDGSDSPSSSASASALEGEGCTIC